MKTQYIQRQNEELFYNPYTSDDVIDIIERYRDRDIRLSFYYGDAKELWGDIETGYIGNSTGNVKVPLAIHNKRSMGAGSLLTHCVQIIKLAKGKKTLYNPNKLTEV